MSSIFGIAGYYFGLNTSLFAIMAEVLLTFILAGKPTTATDQKSVSMAPGSMPWQSDGSKGDQARANYKYKYHPGGDPRAEQKEAPSALHSVVVPNVTLPKVSWDRNGNTRVRC